MGSLTQAITRLCGDITALRDSRQALMGHVARQTLEMKGAVSGMRAGFRKAHADMAKRTKDEQAKFVANMATDVSGMLKGFHKEHEQMAAQTAGELGQFVSDIEAEVTGMLKGFHKAQSQMAAKTKKSMASID